MLASVNIQVVPLGTQGTITLPHFAFVGEGFDANGDVVVDFTGANQIVLPELLSFLVSDPVKLAALMQLIQDWFLNDLAAEFAS